MILPESFNLAGFDGMTASAVSVASDTSTNEFLLGRMPKASYKQQLSYLNGWLWHLDDGPAAKARNKTMEVELSGQIPLKSANLYGDPSTVLECYGYDAELHADEEIAAFLNKGRPVRDAATTVSQEQARKVANWFLPDGHKFKVQSKL